MKVSVTVQFTADDDPAGDIVTRNLKDVGFELRINENGYMCLSFDGDVSNNDLAYRASMFKRVQRNGPS